MAEQHHRIIVDSDASGVDETTRKLDQLADTVDDLGGRSAELHVEAVAKGEDEIRDLVAQLGDVDGETVKATLEVKASEARSQLKDIAQLLADTDGMAAQVDVQLRAAELQGQLREVESQISRLDGNTADVKVEANAGDARGDLDAVAAQARELDGKSVKINVDSSGVDGLLGKLGDLSGSLGDMGGQIGELGGSLGSLGSAAGPLAIAGGFLAAADSAADMATSVQETANLTGDSLDFVSRLQGVWTSTGADVNDLQDVLLQMNGVLQTSPDLAAKLGINLNDGAGVGERFTQVITALNTRIGDTAERSQIASQAFGEEGVRQVNAMITSVGDLGTAMENIPEGKLVDEGDVQAAKQYQANITQVKQEFMAVVATVGNAVLPVINQLAQAFAPILDALGLVSKGIQKISDAAEAIHLPDILGWLNPITLAFDKLPKLGDKLGLDEIPGIVKGAGDKLSDFGDKVSDVFGGGDFEGAVQQFAVLEKIKQVAADSIDQWQRYQAATQLAAAAQDVLRVSMAANAVQLAVNTEKVDQLVQRVRDTAGLAQLGEAMSSTDWGRAALDGATQGMAAFTEQHNQLANRAQAVADAERNVVSVLGEVGKGAINFDVLSEKGAANQDAIEGLATALDTQLAQAFADAGGSFQSFNQSAQQIGDATLNRLASQMGLSASQVGQLKEQLGLLPSDIRTRYELSGDAEAAMRLQLLQGAMQNLPEEVQVRVQAAIARGDFSAALQAVQGQFESNPLKVNTALDTSEAVATVQAFTGQQRQVIAKVLADPAQAEQALGALTAKQRQILAKVIADPAQAEATLHSLSAQDRRAVVTAIADTKAAETGISIAARTRQTAIAVSSNFGEVDREGDNAARPRSSHVAASSDFPAVGAAGDRAARGRSSYINVGSNASSVSADIDAAARARQAVITVIRNVLGGGGDIGGDIGGIGGPLIGADRFEDRTIVNVPASPANVTVNVNASTIGSPTEIARTVAEATRRAVRLDGKRQLAANR